MVFPILKIVFPSVSISSTEEWKVERGKREKSCLFLVAKADWLTIILMLRRFWNQPLHSSRSARMSALWGLTRAGIEVYIYQCPVENTLTHCFFSHEISPLVKYSISYKKAGAAWHAIMANESIGLFAILWLA